MIATLHFAEETFTLHLFLERLQRLIDVVIADHDLNYLKLSIGFPDRLPGKSLNVQNAETTANAPFRGCAGPFGG